MFIRTYLLLVISTLLLVACGGGDDGGGSAVAPASDAMTQAAGDTAATVAGAASDAMESASDGATRYIDHSKDEMEFQLKQSIDGWKSLLEDVSDSDEVANIKAHIADLESQLGKL